MQAWKSNCRKKHPLSWMTAFRTMFSEALKPFTQRVDAIRTTTNPVQVDISTLADRATRLEQADAAWKYLRNAKRPTPHLHAHSGSPNSISKRQATRYALSGHRALPSTVRA
eukprot:TRINITY_DN20493_c0_g1_i3.p2 TRINITY_DN20493_c0_g1~~TRINITY_DN20493_c0_g1_i3.p2  ORF type:complete len:112 (+),score=4.93 TRINITY_DN20493_c0_g1_i3:262-597(+)